MKYCLAASFFQLFFPLCTWAKFSVPPLRAPVQDDAGVLSEQTIRNLDPVIRKFWEQAQVQLQILTLQTTDELPIESASIQIVDEWKLGKKGTDKGLLILIAVKDRKIRVEVGKGLEGDIPDAYAKRIVSDVMAPFLRKGDYDRGVISAVASIANILQLDVGLQTQRAQRQERPFNWVVLLLFGFFFLITIIQRIAGVGSGYHRGIFWGGGGGGWGGGSGGGGGSWGGGGGGFSGGGSSGDF